MIVRINDYYKLEIDKVKEASIKENYKLKSPYLFIGMNILIIVYEIMLLTEYINTITVIIYVTPVLLGTCMEIQQMKIYNKLDLGIEKIRKLLYLTVLRMMNLILFLTGIFLMIGNSVIESILLKSYFLYDLNDSSYDFKINIGIIVFLLIILIFSSISFFIGIRIEKKQVIKNKKKKFFDVGFITIFILPFTILFKNIFMNIPYIYFLLAVIFIIFFMSYAIGKMYFRYKNFDKKVIESNKMIDYKL